MSTKTNKTCRKPVKMKYEVIFNDVLSIKPDIYNDSRGEFSEVFNKEKFKNIGIDDNFLQDNLSLSLKAMTIRGLHFQEKPFVQSKLIKVLHGSIFDVFIDLRLDSDNYEKYGSLTLKPSDGWIYIPRGFAHGFCTLEDSTKILYKVDNHYSKDAENGIAWDDPFYNIDWPIGSSVPILSDKDSKLPKWNEIKSEIVF